ncbi:MAG: methylenetetrahydrofolate reductase [Acidobacteria bacterium]|nr:MAG: methylenetetrahydrofolate reductase [Acidobacteriota bacterium]
MTDATPSNNIARMLNRYSIELHPGDSKAQDAARGRLRPGTEVFLTWIPGTNPMELVESAARLRRAGMFPVPHVGARHLESSAQLEQFAARLGGDAGVDRILLIGGDRAKPAGPYDSSLAVLQSEVFQRVGITRVAIAGFPEGNPNIPDSVLEDALRAKVNFAVDSGLELSIVTQFCFTAEPIVSWLQRIRDEGIENPVRVGLAGPASVATLMRYAVRCGIGKSLHVLTEHPYFTKLLTEKSPGPIIRDIVAQAGAGNNGSLPLGIAGLHFFVFGGFSKTVDWISAQWPD